MNVARPWSCLCPAGRTLLLFLTVLGATDAAALSQERAGAPEPGDESAAADVVAATVEGVAISVGEVRQQLRRAVGDRKLDEPMLHRLQAEALEQLIKRHLALATLQRRGEACNPQQLELAVSRFEDELLRQNKTLDDYCRAEGITVAGFKRAMRWQLSWTQYVEKLVTDERLEQYFAEHRADFDGTRLRVAQILLTWPEDPAARAGVEQRVAAIRDEIGSGRVSFAEAARRHSQSPSAQEGGKLEWIARHEPMPEFFNEAAYRLQVGQVSAPVVSPLGVHLIQCLEIEPGKRTWQDVRGELVAAVKAELFEQAVAGLGRRPDVHCTGAVPYFKPGTRTLVVPGQDGKDNEPDSGRAVQ